MRTLDTRLSNGIDLNMEVQASFGVPACAQVFHIAHALFPGCLLLYSGHAFLQN